MTTATDIPTLSLFCGAGGDYEGAKQVDGVRGVGAANHSHLAIASHSENHPDVPHYEVDIRQFDPSEYADHVLLLATPECRAHSYSPGLKAQLDAESLADDDTMNREASREQSRMTMFEVGRVLAAKQPAYGIIENVPEVARWRKFGQWEQAIRGEGYTIQFVNLNARFVSGDRDGKAETPTPQSRDRLFLVCTRHGQPQPDLTFSPPAECDHCGSIAAQQVFKREGERAGRYNRQYIYVCPHCWARQQHLTPRKTALANSQVKPHDTPAASLIDWSLPCPRIGDRPRLLRPTTLQRVALGLLKYSPTPFAVETSRTYAPSEHITELNQVLPTQTSRQTLALVQPADVQTSNSGNAAQSKQRQRQSNRQGNQLTLPFLTERRGSSSRSVRELLSTVTASGAHHALAQPTEASPDFLLQFYSRTEASQAVNTPLHTVTTEPRHALVRGDAATSFLVDYYGTQASQHHLQRLSQPLPTQASVVGHALAHWQGQWSADSMTQQQLWDAVLHCGLRMLTPTEIIEAMGFYRYRGRGNYVLLGSQREQTKLAGNAVVPVVMEALVKRVQQAIAGERRSSNLVI